MGTAVAAVRTNVMPIKGLGPGLVLLTKAIGSHVSWVAIQKKDRFTPPDPVVSKMPSVLNPRFVVPRKLMKLVLSDNVEASATDVLAAKA